MTIDELISESYGNSRAKGFHEKERNIGEMIALIHSEASEALEEYREREIADLSRHYYEGDGKPIGFPSELADIMIRVADMAGMLGIDLVKAIQEKHAYNRMRPHKHGKRC